MAKDRPWPKAPPGSSARRLAGRQNFSIQLVKGNLGISIHFMILYWQIMPIWPEMVKTIGSCRP